MSPSSAPSEPSSASWASWTRRSASSSRSPSQMSCSRTLASPSGEYGLFAPVCNLHAIEDGDGAWAGMRVASQTQQETLAAWFGGGGRVNALSLQPPPLLAAFASGASVVGLTGGASVVGLTVLAPLQPPPLLCGSRRRCCWRHWRLPWRHHLAC